MHMAKNLRTLNMQQTAQALKDAVHRDTFIIQTIHTIDELELIINKLLTLLRERYGYYAPKAMKQNDTNILLQSIFTKKTETLGIPINETDYAPIRALADETTHLITLQQTQETYLEQLMRETCPHVQTIAGTLLGARLLNLARSLKHLAELPSSTIQVLGAEKALFRHLKTGAKAPRFGILFAHPAITNTAENLRGKTARKLANKIAIAAKQDYFAKL